MKKIIALRNAVRVIGITSALVLALGAGAGLAKASVDVSGGNGTTGPESENHNTWYINAASRLFMHNDSRVDNDQDFDVNTGDNSISNNTEVCDVSTGQVQGTIDVSNALNNGDFAFLGDLGQGDINVDLTNMTTGPYSDNTNVVSIDAGNHVDIHNNANIDNNLRLDANTGRNTVRDNTVVGDISTGDVNFNVNVQNSANQGGNFDLGGLLGGTNVNASLTNNLTGPHSENENSLNVMANNHIDISNTAHIDNDAHIDANTGENTIGCNTVVGDISTGDVDISVSTTNMAN